MHYNLIRHKMMYELIKENAHLFWIGLIAVFALVVLSIYFVVRVFHKRTLPSWAVIVWLLSLVVVFFSFAGIAEWYSWHRGCGLGG